MLKTNKAKNTTQKTKKMINMDPPKTEGEPRGLQRVSSSYQVTHIVNVLDTNIPKQTQIM
jgi:hypothetical protein